MVLSVLEPQCPHPEERAGLTPLPLEKFTDLSIAKKKKKKKGLIGYNYLKLPLLIEEDTKNQK